MDKDQLRNLMTFVVDSNNTALHETITNTLHLELTEEQLRTILNVLESKTKDCFFRVMEKM